MIHRLCIFICQSFTALYRESVHGVSSSVHCAMRCWLSVTQHWHHGLSAPPLHANVCCVAQSSRDPNIAMAGLLSCLQDKSVLMLPRGTEDSRQL